MSAEEQKRTAGRPKLPDDQAARSHLHLRIKRQRKAAYVRAAQSIKPKALTLADWCFKHLDKAAGYTDEQSS